MTTRFEVNQTSVTQFSAEERELAYEIWILEAGRNHTLTARLFEERTKKPIHFQTIRKWVAEDRWAERFMADMEIAFPHARKETAANLVMAGMEASRKLLAHVNAERKITKHEDGRELVTYIGQRIEKGDEKVLLGLLDRAGFSPVGTKDPVAGSAPEKIQQSSLIEKLLSPEERAAIAAEAGISDESEEK